MKKAGIIGGSGFIGSHITKQFLDNGFEVKVSTKDLSNLKKYQHLSQLKNVENLSFRELDVTDKNRLENFIKDYDIVIHSGTPLQLDVDNPQRDLFDPTIKGTDNFLEIIHNSPKVKKVIVNASVTALNTNFPLPAGGKSATDHFSKNDIPFTSKESHPYAQAKFIANQTVNDFIEKYPNLDTEIVSISPVMVMGKSFSNREDSTSTGLQFLFKNKIAPNPFIQMFYDENITMATANVKDVAIGAYKAGTISGLHGENYLLSSETYSVSDVTLMLNNQSPKHAPETIYHNQLAKRELGIPFQSVQSTLKEYNS
jgi:nucleoside-diphosphate-sugar epimerase